MFGGKSAVMPSFRLKKKRKAEPPPQPPHPAPQKIFRQEDLHRPSPKVPIKQERDSQASTMPSRKIEKRGRPPKTENTDSKNGRKKTEKLNNNNNDRTSPPEQSPPQLPQVPSDVQIGFIPFVISFLSNLRLEVHYAQPRWKTLWPCFPGQRRLYCTYKTRP